LVHAHEGVVHLGEVDHTVAFWDITAKELDSLLSAKDGSATHHQSGEEGHQE
jgi:hypothetical protein